MGRLTRFLLCGFRGWDRSSQIAMAIAMVLLMATILTVTFGPPDLRQPALIGGIGLFIVAQVIFMWANRGMVTPYTLAQRHYLVENFAAAREVLERELETGKPDFRLLTLLGNTYRQLGLADESEEVLTKALDLAPFDHFPLYGFGRTLLIKGMYGEAAAYMQRALEAGAPAIVQLDLAEALFRAGERDTARSAVETVSPSEETEPHRLLLAQLLRYRLGAGGTPPGDLVAVGLPYWRETAARFAHTPYGQVLAVDIQLMGTLMEGR